MFVQFVRVALFSKQSQCFFAARARAAQLWVLDHVGLRSQTVAIDLVPTTLGIVGPYGFGTRLCFERDPMGIGFDVRGT